jgi:UDP-N-acetylglucosamine diphosphorylase / glucose-1-phosphate thymidylyltransferase / UDP-N-acetylgalactosamine diphosphorylase / glucosamine-1-phosphate N-acetyltransferase / galactosamine-1-phosphate N-acetyltransferase
MKVVILTAGKGRRLSPLTDTRPKCMIEICGQSLLERIFRCLQDIGLNHYEIVIGSNADKIRNYCSENELNDFSYFFTCQHESSGIGNALLKIKNRIAPSDYFMLVYGDILFSHNMLSNLINSFKSLQKPVASVCLTHNSSDFGNIYMNDQMQITEIIEKPPRNDLGNYILAGAFILPSSIFDYLEKHQENMIDAYREMMLHDGFYASIWEGNWIDIGYPWDILTANQIIMDEWQESRIASDLKQEAGSLIQGPVIIEPGVTIKAGAHILGPCFIGANSFIGHSALLRTYTSVGAKSIVGYGVEMKNSVLFYNAEVGRLSFIGDSIIGERVNIGSGTVMVNINIDQSNVKVQLNGDMIDSGLKKLGSLIGDESWIGAGHTFLPGTKLPAKSLIPHNATLEKVNKEQ